MTDPEAGRDLQLREPAGETDVGEDPGSAESGQATTRGRRPMAGAILASAPAPGGEVAATPTRASAAWTAAVGAVALLLLLAVFVGQNSRSSEINFLSWHGRAPLAAFLLMAAVFGGALVAAAGVARILQLRRRRTRSESSAD